jgi:hypothetical protein
MGQQSVLRSYLEARHEFPGTNSVSLKTANDLASKLRELDGLPSKESFALIPKLEQRYLVTVARELYGGKDPAEVPRGDLDVILGLHNDGAEPEEIEYKERVKNPVSAVRAFCVQCMGGSVAYVTDCTAVTCMLWPFRMGHNAFYGKLSDTESEAESTEADDGQ